MAVDRWNGNGDWNGNPGDWSTGIPPASTDYAEIQSGTDTLSTTAAVKAVTVDSGNLLNIGSGATLTTSAWLNNAGTFDTTSGSTVGIGGLLTNSGTANLGNTGLSTSTSVTAAGLINSGSINLQGNAGSGTTDQATLDITGGPGLSTVMGSVRVLGDADLELASGIAAVG